MPDRVVVDVEGLDGSVEIIRDCLGVPHCYATTERDAFFAQGWVHATDRLRQMELVRRRGLGRLAEVTGATAAKSDTFFRRISLGSRAEADWKALGAATQSMLQAYSDGVNAAAAALRRRRADASGMEPIGGGPGEASWGSWQTWMPWDSITVYRCRHVLMGSAPSKLWRTICRDVLGVSLAQHIFSVSADEESTCVVPQSGIAGSDHWDGQGGSNNWVVDGRRTATGRPILAGDPHRELESPNVYIQGHVVCPQWNVLGLTFAGVPGFSHFGHNEHVAWGITHAMLDDQDVYEVRAERDAAGPVESIAVRDAEPIQIALVESQRGPLIHPHLALSWSATGGVNRGFDCILPMLRASSVEELFSSMALWVEPGNNLLAADTANNIGYLTRGRVPIRLDPGASVGVVPADDSRFGWRGWVAFSDMPMVINPPNGVLVSANNRILPPGVGPYLGSDFAPAWRARRIRQLLESRGPLSTELMRDILRDVVSTPGQWFAERFADALPGGRWDGHMASNSVGAAGYSVLRREITLLVMELSGLDKFSDHWLSGVLPGVHVEAPMWRIADAQFRRSDESLLGGRSWAFVVKEAETRAARAFQGQTWGDLHKTAFRSDDPDAVEPPSVAYGGDMDTVQAASYAFREGFDARSASVARYVFDVGDWDRSKWVVPLGTADARIRGDGHTSVHSTDQQAAWSEGQLYDAPYSRAAVVAGARDWVILSNR